MRPGRAIVGTLLVLAANSLAHAVEKPKSSDTIWLERIEAGCKADAKNTIPRSTFRSAAPS